MPLFALKLLLNASIEEERDVGVFLGLYKGCISFCTSERAVDLPAIWHCLYPCLAIHSASTLAILAGGKATGKVHSGLYRDIVVMD